MFGLVWFGVTHPLFPSSFSSGDNNRVVEYLNKKLDIYENKQPDEEKYTQTLKLFLPDSKYYDSIKDAKNSPSIGKIYIRLIDITERNDTKTITSAFKDRRLRASASPNTTASSLLEQVEADVYSKSNLKELYETLLQQADTDDTIDTQVTQIKLLQLYRKQLPALPKKNEVSDMNI